MQRLVSRRWAGAEKRLDAASQTDQQVARAKRRGIDARAAAGRARAAWRKAERAFGEAVQAAAALEWIKAAFALFRPDGQLNDRAWAQQQIMEAMDALVGEEWGKVRRLWHDPRTLNHGDWLHVQRAQAVPDPL